ncbi:MAG: alpha/beta hydrolase [Proteobacteria bacterium]|nr:alpha/beta hydrolase [Pseudomonadota bacterium]
MSFPSARQIVAQRIIETTSRWAAGATLDEIRAGFVQLLRGPTPGEVDEVEFAGMRATWTHPPERKTAGIVLYLHGGGFQIGSPASHKSLICRLAAAAGVSILTPNYRLAPEHRFPAQVEDGLHVYKVLMAAGHSPEKIAIAGDSAGGNLALVLAQQARDLGLGQPAALALISPWLDLTLRGESYTSRAEKDIFSKPEALRAMARTYIGKGGDAAHPLANPLEASLANLPPMLVHAGDFDITLDDSTLLKARADAAGAACTLKVWPEMYHHFQVFAELPEAQESIEEIGAFLRQALQ